MDQAPSAQNRKRTRLQGFDYSSGYAYFITLCVHQRLPLFGSIRGGVLFPSEAGSMVARIWEQMPEHNPGLVLDVFAIMPDHLHAILGLIDAHVTSPQLEDSSSQPIWLPELIKRYKTLSQHYYGIGVKEHSWPPYRAHLWQRSYYDRIIRSDKDLENHRQYVFQNALTWGMNN